MQNEENDLRDRTKAFALQIIRMSAAIPKCGDSLRELEETVYWLEVLVDARIVPAEKFSVLREECDELIAIFVTT